MQQEWLGVGGWEGKWGSSEEGGKARGASVEKHEERCPHTEGPWSRRKHGWPPARGGDPRKVGSLISPRVQVSRDGVGHDSLFPPLLAFLSPFLPP